MILVTGAAGFIGHQLVNALTQGGEAVVGIDNLNDYYDPQLKWDRLADAGVNRSEVEATRKAKSEKLGNYTFHWMNLSDKERLKELFERYRFDKVCNLAAQAGVRYSLINPQAYIDTNLTGFLNILENCRSHKIKHLVYASSSSVYGLNEKIPFAETDQVDQPVSLYAATKRSNELFAHTYSHLYGLPVTGLRFFTVYGPWGRPDMAYSIFSDAILNDRPIRIFNHGRMSRDFTFVADIVEGVKRVLLHPRPPQQGVQARMYNIGNGSPVKLLDFVEIVEKNLGKKAEKILADMQPGDVEKTFADTTALERDYGYKASTPLEVGIAAFVAWYKKYYGYTGAAAGGKKVKKQSTGQ